MEISLQVGSKWYENSWEMLKCVSGPDVGTDSDQWRTAMLSILALPTFPKSGLLGVATEDISLKGAWMRT